MIREIKTEQDCRMLYADIVNGYSEYGFDGLFLRHFSELDVSITEHVRVKFAQDGLVHGLLSEKDKLKLLDEKGHWTELEEKEFQEAKSNIDGLYYSRKGLVIPQQIEHINKTIQDAEREFKTKFSSRFHLIGQTVEHYSLKRASENHVLRSFFKDSALKTPYFTQEDIDDLSERELSIFIDKYNSIHNLFFERNFKKIAVCPFFLNGYMQSSGNPQIFYGKPIVNLTIYQLALFNRGAYYKDILQSPESKQPPEEFYSNLDEVIKFYDRQYSIILGKRTNNQLIPQK